MRYPKNDNNPLKKRLKNDIDVSPIPDWIKSKVIDKMVKAKLVPPDWIDSIEINDYRKGTQ